MKNRYDVQDNMNAAFDKVCELAKFMKFKNYYQIASNPLIGNTIVIPSGTSEKRCIIFSHFGASAIVSDTYGTKLDFLLKDGQASLVFLGPDIHVAYKGRYFDLSVNDFFNNSDKCSILTEENFFEDEEISQLVYSRLKTFANNFTGYSYREPETPITDLVQDIIRARNFYAGLIKENNWFSGLDESGTSFYPIQGNYNICVMPIQGEKTIVIKMDDSFLLITPNSITYCNAPFCNAQIFEDMRDNDDCINFFGSINRDKPLDIVGAQYLMHDESMRNAFISFAEALYA